MKVNVTKAFNKEKKINSSMDAKSIETRSHRIIDATRKQRPKFMEKLWESLHNKNSTSFREELILIK